MQLSKELDDALCQDFPNTFKDRHGDMRETLMCFGFSCGDGWEVLIRRCAAALETYILTLPEEVRSQIAAAQVKEKFGLLRFYTNGPVPRGVLDLIDAAEAESAYICEVCGVPGSNGEIRGWYMTRCSVHWDLERNVCQQAHFSGDDENGELG